MEEKLTNLMETMRQIDALMNEAFGEINRIHETWDVSGITNELSDAEYHMSLIAKSARCARGYFHLAIDKTNDD